MTLADYMAALNANIFLREFSFSRNQFDPLPKNEVEFADHVIWIDDLLLIYQLKEREKAKSPGASAERKWFEKKILGKATKQIRDTLKYLAEQNSISISNQRGHVFTVDSRKLARVIKIVVHASSRELPEDLWQVKHHMSSTAGFIHIIPIHDYLGICQTLITPTEISEYFEFREQIVRKWSHLIKLSSEPALVGQFVYGNDDGQPSEEYRQLLASLRRNISDFDNSHLLYNFAEHIEQSRSQNIENDYYNILIEFAKMTRIEHKEIKARVKLCLEQCNSDEVIPPYRIIAPNTGCGFVFIPLPKNLADYRLNALESLTYAAKYDQKLQRCIGISFAKDGEDFLIDWLYIDSPWQFDAEMARRLQEKFPFRELKPKPFVRYEFDNPKDVG